METGVTHTDTRAGESPALKIRIILEETDEQKQAEQFFQACGISIGYDSDVVVVSDSPQICSHYLEKGIAVIAVLKNENAYPGVLYAVMDYRDIDGEYIDRVYRRYHGLPWDICETERCLIRETTVDDVEAFYAIYQEKSVTEYMEDLFEDPEEERRYIRDYIDKVYGFYGFGMWTVCLKSTGEVIGRAGLSMREGFEEPELGYVIGVPWQRKGLAEEVCREIIRYGKEELEMGNIQILMEEGNVASENLCKKLGFIFAGQISWKHKDFNRFLLA